MIPDQSLLFVNPLKPVGQAGPQEYIVNED
jgi:hypothetical protein